MKRTTLEFGRSFGVNGLPEPSDGPQPMVRTRSTERRSGLVTSRDLIVGGEVSCGALRGAGWGRRLRSALGVLALLVLLGAGLGRVEAARPNIVVILADDLGWSDLGCYDSKLKNTPRLDRLASEGVRLTQAYCAQPICSPSRAAILTGRTPARLGLTDYIPGRRVLPSQRLLKPQPKQALPLQEITLAERLKGLGYSSACIGKWHLGGEGFGAGRQGFDVVEEAPGNADPAGPGGGKSEHTLTASAIRFMESRRESPFFLYLAHHTPHIPLSADPELVKKYSGAPNPTYAAMLEVLDGAVGGVLDALDRLGLATNTIVVFTSDNGGLSVVEHVNTPATSNAPLRGGKGHLYEGGVRVPMLVRYPGVIPAGKTVRVPVINTDLVPTLVELAGGRVEERLDGVSLAGLLRGGGAPARAGLFWHYPHYSNQKGEPAGAARIGDWKLLEFFETGRVELYNVAEDPSETMNLAVSEPHRTREMLEQLRSWRSEAGAAMPTLNPGYDPKATWNTAFPGGNGVVTLHSSAAEVHGLMLRYEPQPHKNTLGYWVRKEDWASWDFEVGAAGRYEVELLQGCGKGSGGAEVEVKVGDQSFIHTVEDTGHFQNFVPRVVGTAALPAGGRYTLSLVPRTKPGVAVMDVRAVTLRPVAGK